MRVRYTARALEDLQSIYVGPENPPAAARLIDRIESVVEELGHNPSMAARPKYQECSAFR